MRTVACIQQMASLALVIATAPLFAADNSPFSDTLAEFWHFLTTDPKSVAKTPTPQQEEKKQQEMVINPNARPALHRRGYLFTTIDALLWQAHEGGLCDSVKNNGTNLHAPLEHARAENPHFTYNWGFRLGAGYETPHDGWDLYATWTQIHLRAHSHTAAGPDQLLWPNIPHSTIQPLIGSDLLGDPISIGLATDSSSSHWKAHLSLVDLEMGRSFKTSQWLSLRPFVGLRSAWIRQKLHLRYDSLILPSTRTAVFLESRVTMKNNYWGLGPRFGLNTDWKLGKGFSLFGNAAFSLLYGYFKTQFKETEVDPEDTSEKIHFADTHNNFRQSVPITDLQCGLAWDHLFARDRYHLGLAIGWEHHVFFSQNQFIHFVDDVQVGNFVENHGNLTTQGWTFSLRFDF